MYQAELRGKLPSEIARSEDILTSNVFSFFKYADRKVYLRALLERLGLDLTEIDLSKAEFHFWPSFDDNTEPDVVILVGGFYILIEAKYLSGFGQPSTEVPGQLERELAEGFREARSQGKSFVPVVMTAHSCCPSGLLANIPQEHADRLRWINWQAVAGILLEALEVPHIATPDEEFATDLYNLLDKKKLRGFITFDRLQGSFSYQEIERVFFASESSLFRGDFIGFSRALAVVESVISVSHRPFFTRKYFLSLPMFTARRRGAHVFWRGHR